MLSWAFRLLKSGFGSEALISAFEDHDSFSSGLQSTF